MMQFKIRIRAFKQDLVSIENFTLVPGQITVLLGESGIGKTLIAQAVFGLLDAHELQVWVNDERYLRYLRSARLKKLRASGFFVFQEPSSHLNPMLTINQQLNEGSLRNGALQKRVLEGLWQKPYNTHIQPLLNVYPTPFRPSGGEKQRFLLAMALKKMRLHQPPPEALYIFDEPTGSLDDAYRNVFLKELFDLYRRNPVTILLITHDYSMLSELQRRYSDLLSKIHIKELRRVRGTQVEMTDFKMKNYLNWLEALQPFRSQGKNQPPVLKMNGMFQVFDHTFQLKRTRRARKAETLTVKSGDLVYLKAPSGVGKTTLAKIIAGLQKAQFVRFSLAGNDFTEKTPQRKWKHNVWGEQVSMVFQHADEALNLQARVKDVFKGLPGVSALSQFQIRELLGELFEEVQEEDFLEKKIAHLSGGQRQRLNLMRVFALNPRLIILDEPLNGLDFFSIQKVIDLIARKMQKGSGILLISHNEEIFDRLVEEKRRIYLTRLEDV